VSGGFGRGTDKNIIAAPVGMAVTGRFFRAATQYGLFCVTAVIVYMTCSLFQTAENHFLLGIAGLIMGVAFGFLVTAYNAFFLHVADSRIMQMVLFCGADENGEGGEAFVRVGMFFIPAYQRTFLGNGGEHKCVSGAERQYQAHNADGAFPQTLFFMFFAVLFGFLNQVMIHRVSSNTDTPWSEY